MFADASCFTAYSNGRDATLSKREHDKGGAPGNRALLAGKDLLRSGYERLLELECCPERVGEQQASPLGKIEKIRIQW